MLASCLVWEAHLEHVVCPGCKSSLALSDVRASTAGRIQAAILVCTGCLETYPVAGGVPRFVSDGDEAASFGLQWTLHARTQYDSHSETRISETRFFRESRWPRDLRGERVLEVGCGSGRFTEQALGTGALVASFDHSRAVDANYAAHGAHPRALIVQADLYRAPFRQAWFNRLFCFGVLQHTPDVRRAFLALPTLLRPGGELIADVHRPPPRFATKYWVRRLTARIQPARLYRLVRLWVDLMWLPACLFARLGPRGEALNYRLLVPHYACIGVPPERLKDWAYLDAFDMLSPRHDSPQTLETMQRWCEEAGLANAEVGYGYNGIEVRGTRRD